MAEPVKETPSQHSQTPQSMNGNVEYPNYFTFQDRCGNTPWFINNTRGNEFIMCQHRSGSYWELSPTGSFNIVASQNREDITFGKHVSYVTGAQDTTVDGDSSVKTNGTRRITTNGNSEQSVKGDAAISAKSINMAASEGVDLAGQSFTAKTKSALIQATDGPVTLSAVGNAALSSKEGSVGIQSEVGAVTMESGWSISIKGNEVHIKGGGGEVVMKGGNVYINSGMFQEPKAVWRGREAGSEKHETAPYRP